MKLPKHVKEALAKSADNYQVARKQQLIFQEWVEKNFGEEAINHDNVRDAIVNWVEQTNNPHIAIKQLESELDDFMK
ncbi:MULTISPECIES: hypothetical protein [Siminovitchia]|uniref:Uncharacterized protein n=1 Tax=Siminovitchia sediminis TaxID=1274353 RepID=A0ABW4KN80_9BACI|nr:hypothetical protein [Siminovitchia fortis]